MYCGELSKGGIDHWPPKLYSDDGFLIPSCTECSNWAGIVYPKNFYKRVEYVKAAWRDDFRVKWDWQSYMNRRDELGVFDPLFKAKFLTNNIPPKNLNKRGWEENET